MMDPTPRIPVGPVCPCCATDDAVGDLGAARHAPTFTGGAWSCGRCLHAWRTEPWYGADRIEFFQKAIYTAAEHESWILATKVRLFAWFEELAAAHWPSAPRRMVDFGCAYGNCMEAFRGKGWEVCGVEISPSAQRILDQRGLTWTDSLERLPFEDGSVHACVMSDCTYYLPEPVAVLRSVARVLHPRGVLLLRQPTRGGLVRLLYRLREFGLPHAAALRPRLWLDHVHLFSRRSTGAMLERAGFEADFLPERGFRRSWRGEVLHRGLRLADAMTWGSLDLSAAWTVTGRVAAATPTGADAQVSAERAGCA